MTLIEPEGDRTWRSPLRALLDSIRSPAPLRSNSQPWRDGCGGVIRPISLSSVIAGETYPLSGRRESRLPRLGQGRFHPDAIESDESRSPSRHR